MSANEHLFANLRVKRPLPPMNTRNTAIDGTKFVLRAFAMIVAVLLVMVFPVVIQDGVGITLVGLSISMLLMLSFPLFFRSSYNTFEPLTLVLLLYLFGVPLKLVYILWNDASPYIAERLLLGRDAAALVKGTTIMTLAFLFLVLGYRIGRKIAIPKSIFLPKIRALHSKKAFFVCGLITFISGLLFVGFIRVAGIGLDNISAKRFSDEAGSAAARIHTLEYFLYRGAALSKPAAYLLFVGWLSKFRSMLTLEFGLCCLAIVQTLLLFFVMNSRAGMALFVLDLIVLIHFVRGRLPVKILLPATALVASLIVGALLHRSDGDINQAIEKSIAGRDLMDISKTCHIINAVPTIIDYRMGETLYGWLAAPIPRSVWPDKPMWAERGTYINMYVYGDKAGISGIPPGLIAELYWNFDVVGVIVGMLLIGVLFRSIFVTFDALPRSPVTVLIYTVVATRLVLFSLGNDLGTGIVKTALDLLPLMVLAYIVRAKNTSVQPSQHTPTPDLTSDANKMIA